MLPIVNDRFHRFRKALTSLWFHRVTEGRDVTILLQLD